jgi:hypothetical protein
MFILLMSEYYHHNGNDVSLKNKELSILLRIINEYAKFAKNNEKKYADLDSDKNVAEKDKWTAVMQAYNTNLLTNSK